MQSIGRNLKESCNLLDSLVIEQDKDRIRRVTILVIEKMVEIHNATLLSVANYQKILDKEAGIED